MSASIIPFAFDSRAVRSMVLDGEPWFVAKDIAELLGYADPKGAISKHCKGALKQRPLPTAGGTQDMRLIAEPDVWRLIVRSKLPEAQAIEAWLFEEVLPSLRRSGSYSIAASIEQTVPATDLMAAQTRELELSRKLIEVQEKLLAATGKKPKRKAVRPITRDEIAEMKRLRALGLPVAEIARRTGRSAAAISQLTRDVAATADLFGGVQ